MKLTPEELKALKGLVPKDIQVIWEDGGFCEISTIDTDDFYIEFTIKAKSLNFIEVSINEMWLGDHNFIMSSIHSGVVIYKWDTDQAKEFGIHVLEQVDFDDNLNWLVEGETVKKKNIYD